MALEGRLSEFTLEEILQLISLQQKTGVLSVDASYAMVLYFEGGELAGYRDRRGAAPDPLQVYLKSYGFFTPEAWEHLEFIQGNSTLDFTEILINEGHVSPEELTRIQHDVAQEHIFKGMLLRDGRYYFRAGRDVLRGIKGRVRIKVEGLLMEAARRIDEIASLQERYFAASVRIRRTDKDPEEPPTGQLMLRVLQCLGRESTLGSIESQARMSHFDLLQSLESLRDLGLIEVLDVPAEPEPAPELSQVESAPGRLHTAALSLVAISLLAIAVSWWWRPLQDYAEQPTVGTERAAAFRAGQERARLDAALTLYREVNGEYPDRIEALGDPMYLGDSVEGYTHYRYVRSSSTSYQLTPADR
jgi:hypothetical protein